jgi:hypothetical protein
MFGVSILREIFGGSVRIKFLFLFSSPQKKKIAAWNIKGETRHDAKIHSWQA